MGSDSRSPQDGLARPLDVFRLPNFLAFWSAETVSGFGSYITTLAVQTTVVLLLGGTATDVGLVTMAALLPNLFLGPIAGAVVDRFRRLQVLVATDIGNGAVLCLLPLLWIIGSLSIPALMAIMAASNVLTILNRAASQSVLPRLVPRPHLLAANARIDQGATVAQTSGSFVAGGLIALLGAPIAVLVDAASYFLSAAAIATIRQDEQPQKPRGALRTIHAEIGEAIRWLYGHKVLGPLALSTHIWFFANGIVGTALVAFTLQKLQLGPFWLGVVYAAAGIAGLIGSFLAVRVGRWLGEGTTVIACRALACLAWVPVALVPDQAPLWLAVALPALGQALFGLSIGVENASESSIWQNAVPDELQARVVATRRSVNRSMIVVGAPAGGLLADLAGFASAFWVGVAIFAIAAGSLALTGFHRVREA
jgi:MFS family permease